MGSRILTGTTVVSGFAIFVHSQSSITDQVARWKSFALGISFFEGYKGFTGIHPLQREDLVGYGEDVNGNCGIHDVGWCGQLV